MFGQKKRNRVHLSTSKEEEIEFLDKTFSSFEEEKLIRQKTKRILRLLSSDSESETEEQDVSQSQEINGNEFTPAVPFVDICWSHQILSPKIHNFDEKDSGCKAALDNHVKTVRLFPIIFPRIFSKFHCKRNK